jgi:hypothetical protein
MSNFYKNTVYKTTDSFINTTDLNSKDSASTRKFIVPAYSSPLTGLEEGEQGTAFKARPIKHWRKQLIPRQETGGAGRAGMVGFMGVPGSSSILGNTSQQACCNNASSTVLTDTILQPISDVSPTNINGNKTVIDNRTICVACNPENNIIKSATTILSKTYYPDRKGYLQSRCLLYDQLLSGNPVAGINYFDANGNVLTPDGKNGVEQRSTDTLLNLTPNSTGSNCTNGISIYKPNNYQYATQGAVDSSSRIARLKYNTITKNGSMTTPYGTAGANANSLYNGTNNNSYFLKNKDNTIPCNYTRDGNKTSACFKASSAIINV